MNDDSIKRFDYIDQWTGNEKFILPDTDIGNVPLADDALRSPTQTNAPRIDPATQFNELKSIRDAIPKIKSDLEKTREESNAQKDVIEKLKEELQKRRTEFIEILGIFVALFTFVSVDIQFSKAEISFWSLVGFTLITLGGLVLFILCLHISLHLNSENEKARALSFRNPFVWLFVLCCFLLGAGVLLVWGDGNKILRKDFFLKKQEETKQELLHITSDLASTSEAVGSVLGCSSTFNTYWDFKNCILK